MAKNSKPTLPSRPSQRDFPSEAPAVAGPPEPARREATPASPPRPQFLLSGAGISICLAGFLLYTHHAAFPEAKEARPALSLHSSQLAAGFERVLAAKGRFPAAGSPMAAGHAPSSHAEHFTEARDLPHYAPAADEFAAFDQGPESIPYLEERHLAAVSQILDQETALNDARRRNSPEDVAKATYALGQTRARVTRLRQEIEARETANP